MVRAEQAGDEAAISAVHRAAFAGQPYSNQLEHRIVERLRERGKLVLSLVSVNESGEVAGHVAFSPVLVDGADLGWVGLGPVGILPEYQRRGLGSELIETGLATLRAAGVAGCVVFGDPAYYERFGFRSGTGLSYPGAPPGYFMALSFSPAPPPFGSVSYDDPFSD
ncbi:MAG TPA: N-acetyltransferase [Telluria sp.]|nr:N-acetyltransferase [Telluria sp.]